MRICFHIVYITVSCLKRQDKTAIFALSTGIRSQEIRDLQAKGTFCSLPTTPRSTYMVNWSHCEQSLKTYYLQDKTGCYDEVIVFWVFLEQGWKQTLTFNVVQWCSPQFLEVILRWLSLPLTGGHRKTAPVLSSSIAATGKQASSSDLQIIIIAH